MKTKWDNWHDSQNETTKAWLDAQAKEDNKLIYVGMTIGFVIGFLFATFTLMSL